MTTKDYVKQLSSEEYKDKVIDQPTELPEDFKALVRGLTLMNQLSYQYIKQFEESNQLDIEPDMKALNCAGTNIQFATSQILATWTAYYDLIQKISKHNKEVAKNQEKKA